MTPNIILARPADPADRFILEQMTGMNLAPYTQSIAHDCDFCERPCFVGPNAASMLAVGKVCCMFCIKDLMMEAEKAGITTKTKVIDLGNPEVPSD